MLSLCLCMHVRMHVCVSLQVHPLHMQWPEVICLIILPSAAAPLRQQLSLCLELTDWLDEDQDTVSPSTQQLALQILLHPALCRFWR